MNQKSINQSTQEGAALRLTMRFLRDNAGMTAPLFGMMALPVLALSGAAIDYGRALSVKSEVQNVIDAAAVSSAMEYAATGDASKAETRLRNFVNSELSEHGLALQEKPEDPTEGAPAPGGNQVQIVTPGIDPTSGSVNPVATSNVPTTMLKLIGISEIPIEVISSAQLSGKKLELSLMLDVTGSMDWWYNGSRKMDDMKFAANDLLDIFKVNLAAGATRIALVPFSEAVNVGNYAEAIRGPYSSGTSWTPGSYQFRFKDWWNNTKTYKITNCVSERTGTERYTDAPPSEEYLGRVYRSGTTCKPSQEIVPLTSDETMLRNVVNGLQPTGGTAGHLGTAWAWYMISDRWAPVWPEVSKPEEPNEDELIKATILMTDGDYNEQYCKGVDDDRINCTSPNGSSKYQAEQLCQQMKNSGIVVYTVGFGISQGSSQEQLMKDCATDNTKFFFPYDGTQLRAAFREIGRQLHAGQAGVKLVN